MSAEQATGTDNLAVKSRCMLENPKSVVIMHAPRSINSFATVTRVSSESGSYSLGREVTTACAFMTGNGQSVAPPMDRGSIGDGDEVVHIMPRESGILSSSESDVMADS